MLVFMQSYVCCAQCSLMCKPRTPDLDIGDAIRLAKADATAKTLPFVRAASVTSPAHVDKYASTISTLGQAEDAFLAATFAVLDNRSRWTRSSTPRCRTLHKHGNVARLNFGENSGAPARHDVEESGRSLRQSISDGDAEDER